MEGDRTGSSNTSYPTLDVPDCDSLSLSPHFPLRVLYPFDESLVSSSSAPKKSSMDSDWSREPITRSNMIEVARELVISNAVSAPAVLCFADWRCKRKRETRIVVSLQYGDGHQRGRAGGRSEEDPRLGEERDEARILQGGDVRLHVRVTVSGAQLQPKQDSVGALRRAS